MKKRIEVLWGKGDRHLATVTHYDSKDGQHHVAYDDGEKKVSSIESCVVDLTMNLPRVKLSSIYQNYAGLGPSLSLMFSFLCSNTHGAPAHPVVQHEDEDVLGGRRYE